MLSPKTQTNLKNAKSYFEEHLAVGDYYAESGHVAGEWIGKGAEMLGLAGVVGQSEFVALCDNTHPRTGTLLTRRRWLQYTAYGTGAAGLVLAGLAIAHI